MVFVIKGKEKVNPVIKNTKYSTRITKCYYIEVVDNRGCVQKVMIDGQEKAVDDFCFGNSNEAKIVAEKLLNDFLGRIKDDVYEV